MSKLFAYDNPIWTFMGKVADVIILSILWFLFSLPIVTIGASTSALYYVTLKLAEDKEGYLFQSFLKGFKENFIQSTIIWALFGCVGGIISVSIVQYQKVGTEVALTLLWALVVFSFVYLLMFSVIFALTARLKTSVGNLFMMSFMVCVKHFSWVLLMAVTLASIIAISLFVFWPALFVAPGAVAFVHSIILIKMIFPKYNWNLPDDDISDTYESEESESIDKIEETEKEAINESTEKEANDELTEKEAIEESTEK